MFLVEFYFNERFYNNKSVDRINKR